MSKKSSLLVWRLFFAIVICSFIAVFFITSCNTTGSPSVNETNHDQQIPGIAPENVSSFTTNAWDGQVKLSWINPDDDNFFGVRIVRKQGSAPQNPEDGKNIFDGVGESIIDNNLENDVNYYYTAFSYSKDFKFSDGVTAVAVPQSHKVSLNTYFPGNHKAKLFWGSDPEADYYILYYTDDVSTPGPDNGTNISLITENKYEIIGLDNFKEYKFAVTSVKYDLESEKSNILRVIIPGITVSAGDHHTIALKDDGTVWTWGWNYYGQLGNGTNNDSNTPVQVVGENGVEYLSEIIAVSAGGVHNIALKNDGTVWAWGINGGILGNNSTSNSNTPVQVLGPEAEGVLEGIVAISAGEGHNIALKQDGTVWTWGENSYGQLGDGTNETKKVPIQVKDINGENYLNNIVAVAAGYYHTIALKNDGTVLAWGRNDHGQLGDSTTEDKSLPVQVKGPDGNGYLKNIIAISAGNGYSAALRDDGTVWTWGINYYGQLGDGSTNDSSVPIEAHGVDNSGYLGSIFLITAGSSHMVSLKNNSTLFTWGNNNYGQLGDNTTTNRTTPVQVLSVNGNAYLSDVVTMAGGSLHTIAMDSSGNVYTWGYNNYGELGNGTYASSHLPVQVPNFSLGWNN